MSLKLITAPALALDLAQTKLDIRAQTGSVEDALITRLIRGAAARGEHETGRAFMDQEWELIIDAFPDAEIRLDKPPVTSITSVKYIDASGTQQTLLSTAYALDADKLPGYLFPALNTSWPATLDVANAVRVRFKCGYATTPALLAEAAPGLPDWLLVQVQTLYENRDLIELAKADAMAGCYGAELLAPYRTWL